MRESIGNQLDLVRFVFPLKNRKTTKKPIFTFYQNRIPLSSSLKIISQFTLLSQMLLKYMIILPLRALAKEFHFIWQKNSRSIPVGERGPGTTVSTMLSTQLCKPTARETPTSSKSICFDFSRMSVSSGSWVWQRPVIPDTKTSGFWSVVCGRIPGTGS